MLNVVLKSPHSAGIPPLRPHAAIRKYDPSWQKYFFGSFLLQKEHLLCIFLIYFSILSFTLPPSVFNCLFIFPYWLKSSFIFSLLFFLSHSLFSLYLWKRRLNHKCFSHYWCQNSSYKNLNQFVLIMNKNVLFVLFWGSGHWRFYEWNMLYKFK